MNPNASNYTVKWDFWTGFSPQLLRLWQDKHNRALTEAARCETYKVECWKLQKKKKGLHPFFDSILHTILHHSTSAAGGWSGGSVQRDRWSKYSNIHTSAAGAPADKLTLGDKKKPPHQWKWSPWSANPFLSCTTQTLMNTFPLCSHLTGQRWGWKRVATPASPLVCGVSRDYYGNCMH